MLDKIINSECVYEVRILDGPQGKTVSGYFNDLEPLKAEAMKYDGKGNVYFTLNPCSPALLARSANKLIIKPKATTSDNDILRRCWLLVDVDPVRPSGVSASDEEKQAALVCAVEIHKYLKGQGWPDPVSADSGNGYHLLYKVDLPNDNESRDTIKACLNVLALQFNNEAVTVDTSVFNAARIVKLYGSLAVKGDNLPERPHRRSTLKKIPDNLQAVPAEKLKALAGKLPKPQTEPRRFVSDVFDIRKWLHDHSISIREEKRWGNNATIYVLETCPFDSAHGKDSRVIHFDSGALSFGCFHNGCSGNDWYSLRDLMEPGWRQAREERQFTRQQQTMPQTDRKAISVAGLLTAPDIHKKIKAVEWIVPGMIARGDVSLVVGAQKGGKSWLWLRGACELSTGGDFLDGFAEVDQQKVLYCMYDNVGEPRVNARIKKAGWNFNPEYIKFVYRENVREQGINIDLDKRDSFFQAIVNEYRPDVVIIDTLGSSHDKNENKNDEMKPIMDKLTAIARDMNIAVVILHHTRKRKAIEYGTAMQMDDSVGASIILRLASNIIGISKVVNEDKDEVHLVKCLGSWHKEFQPFEFSLIDETDDFGRVWLRMPVNLGASVDKTSQDAILRIVKMNYWDGTPFTRQDIIKRTDIGRTTVGAILNSLVIAGILQSDGNTRNRRFMFPMQVKTVEETKDF